MVPILLLHEALVGLQTLSNRLALARATSTSISACFYLNHRSDGTTNPVTSSIVDAGIPDPVVYTVDVVTFYKTDFPGTLPEELEFVTGGAECLVDLIVGEDFLLGLYWDSVENLRVASCGLYRPWAIVSEAELASCFEEFVCDTCGEFQVITAEDGTPLKKRSEQK